MAHPAGMVPRVKTLSADRFVRLGAMTKEQGWKMQNDQLPIHPRVIMATAARGQA